jgi:hypothetical protein
MALAAASDLNDGLKDALYTYRVVWPYMKRYGWKSRASTNALSSDWEFFCGSLVLYGESRVTEWARTHHILTNIEILEETKRNGDEFDALPKADKAEAKKTAKKAREIQQAEVFTSKRGRKPTGNTLTLDSPPKKKAKNTTLSATQAIRNSVLNAITSSTETQVNNNENVDTSNQPANVSQQPVDMSAAQPPPLARLTMVSYNVFMFFSNRHIVIYIFEFIFVFMFLSHRHIEEPCYQLRLVLLQPSNRRIQS